MGAVKWRNPWIVGYYVYLLSNPRTHEVFYVGKGKGGRAEEHLKKGGRNLHLNRKIDAIEREGLRVKIVYQLAESEEYAFAMERAIISVLGRRNIGTGSLVNLTEGGEGASGVVHSEETKNLIREVRNSPEFKANMAVKTAARWADPTYRETVGQRIRAAHLARSKESKIEQARKRAQTMGPQRLSEVGRKRAATLGAERLSAAAKKGNTTRGERAREQKE